MKRGFLLPKGSSSTRISEVNPPSSPTNNVGDVIVHSIVPLDLHDKLLGYRVRVAPGTFDHSSLPSDKSLCTRIPPSPIDSCGSCECLLATDTMRRLYNTPNYPCPPPVVPTSKVYEIRPSDSSSVGRGMFAIQPLKVGDLILVERPSVVLCSNPVSIIGVTPFDTSEIPNKRATGVFWKSAGVFAAILEVLFKRMSKADQAAYLALPNAYKNEWPLVGIWKTNNVMMSKLNVDNPGFTYTGMFREMHRINHSCEPNAAHSFDTASFSIQVRATRPIMKGEEISVSFCNPTISASQRRAWLPSLGVMCACPSCVYNPSKPRNDNIRSSIPKRLKQLDDLRSEPSISVISTAAVPAERLSAAQSAQLQKYHVVALEMKEKASKLMDDIIAEGMEGCSCYFEALETRCDATIQLSCTSKFNASLQRSSLKAQWDSEVTSLATETVMLYNAHYGTFQKHKFEMMLGPFGYLNLPE